MATNTIRLLSPGPKGLTKRELHREQQRWRFVARTALKLIKIPEQATWREIVSFFDAALAEVQFGRDIVQALGRAKPVKARS